MLGFQVAKQLKTVHRLILTGSPIQNNLKELWSLFDFVFPERLGGTALTPYRYRWIPLCHRGWVGCFFRNFEGIREQVCFPDCCRRLQRRHCVAGVPLHRTLLLINHAGRCNDRDTQVQTAYQCAVLLRELIRPYMLRRLKKDVNAQLPKKSEQVTAVASTLVVVVTFLRGLPQVLTCSLTPLQTKVYRKYLRSREVADVLDQRATAFRCVPPLHVSAVVCWSRLTHCITIPNSAIGMLRKLCNHPDLFLKKMEMEMEGDFGDPEKSGKMKVPRWPA